MQYIFFYRTIGALLSLIGMWFYIIAMDEKENNKFIKTMIGLLFFGVDYILVS